MRLLAKKVKNDMMKMEDFQFQFQKNKNRTTILINNKNKFILKIFNHFKKMNFYLPFILNNEIR